MRLAHINTVLASVFKKPSATVEVMPLSFLLTSPLEGKKLSATVQVTPVLLPLSLPEEIKFTLPLLGYDHVTQHNNESPSEPATTVIFIGVGYVRTHLVKAYAHHYDVVAFDLNNKRLHEVAEQLDDLPIQFTSTVSDIGQASHFLISVSIMLNADKTIDTTYLRSATSTVERHAKSGSAIVTESSFMTSSLVGSLMSTKNFLLGMSSEHVDHGRVSPPFKDIRKIVSGLNQASIDSISALYGRPFTSFLPVSTPEVTEMTTLYETASVQGCAHILPSTDSWQSVESPIPPETTFAC